MRLAHTNNSGLSDIAVSTLNKDYKSKYVFQIIGKDFLKMIFELSVSVGTILAIHYTIILDNH